MNPQALMDGLVAGAMIGLGASRRHAHLFDPALRQFRAWRIHRLGRLFCARRRRRAGCAVRRPAAPIGPFSFGWALLIAALVAIALNGGLALLVDALLFGRLRAQNSTVIIMVMASFGAALTLRTLLEFVFTSQPLYFSRALQIAMPLGGGIRATPDQLLSLGVAVVLVSPCICFYRAPRSAAPCARSRRIPGSPASPASKCAR